MVCIFNTRKLGKHYDIYSQCLIYLSKEYQIKCLNLATKERNA